MSIRVSRFYTSQALAPQTDITISDDRAHYIRNVLRLKEGDLLSVFNGSGGEYEGTISALNKKIVSVKLANHNPLNRTQRTNVTLGLCILKRDAMDLTLQKATELGVSTIQPILSERITVSQKQLQSRLSHWQAIVISGCEQCGLNIIPEIKAPQSLGEWCHAVEGSKLIADPNAKASPLPIVDEQTVSILIGPEGGFSPEEISIANASGFAGVYLGERILRAETAAISLLAMVNQRLLESD